MHYATCRRAAATICPAPLLPLWAPKRLAPPSRRQRSSSFPRPTRSHAHRCRCLTHQPGSEQSGLVTLTFNLLTLKVVSKSRVTWAISVPILVFLGLSVLDFWPDVRDRQTYRRTDRQTSDRQHYRLMPHLGCGGTIIILTISSSDADKPARRDLEGGKVSATVCLPYHMQRE